MRSVKETHKKTNVHIWLHPFCVIFICFHIHGSRICIILYKNCSWKKNIVDKWTCRCHHTPVSALFLWCNIASDKKTVWRMYGNENNQIHISRWSRKRFQSITQWWNTLEATKKMCPIWNMWYTNLISHNEYIIFHNCHSDICSHTRSVTHSPTRSHTMSITRTHSQYRQCSKPVPMPGGSVGKSICRRRNKVYSAAIIHVIFVLPNLSAYHW